MNYAGFPQGGPAFFFWRDKMLENQCLTDASDSPMTRLLW